MMEAGLATYLANPNVGQYKATTTVKAKGPQKQKKTKKCNSK